MSEQPVDTTPAIDLGTTRAAGDGIDDQEMATEVAHATSSDLKAQQVFRNEADGIYSEHEAAKADADELGG